MKAIILGAGRIGRGFVSELLVNNGVEISFFDASREMVDELNKQKEYTIHVLGNESKNTKIKDVKANYIWETDLLAEAILDADFIFTACGGKNMFNVGETIAKALQKVFAKNPNKVCNIVTCENWIDPAKDLKQGILENLDTQYTAICEKQIGVSEAVIMCTGTGSPNPNDVVNPMDTWVQDAWYLPVDKDRIVSSLPNWKYIKFVGEFNNLLKQKIYTNNTSVATVAYLGRLKGLTYVAESANDAEIEPILDGVYEEINNALIKGMGIDEESQLKFSKTAKAKYTDYAIVDMVTRIARDPIRKLGPEDRFIGPMTIAVKAGIKPVSIALGAAAALYFDFDEDETAVELQKMRKEHGVDYIFENISRINPSGEVAMLIKEAIETLKGKGWIKE